MYKRKKKKWDVPSDPWKKAKKLIEERMGVILAELTAKQ